MRTLLLGLEQPHVLDRDDGLVGEGGDQFDLLVGEWLNASPPNHDDADDVALPEHGHCEDRPMHLLLVPQIFGPSVLRVRKNIVNVHDAAVQDSPSCG